MSELVKLRKEYPDAVIIPFGRNLFIKLSEDNDRTLLKIVRRKKKTDVSLDGLTKQELKFLRHPEIEKIYWNIVIIFKVGKQKYNLRFI